MSATEQATLGGGCFWCLEHDLEELPGVAEAVSGYSGGDGARPTYRQVSAGGTGHQPVAAAHVARPGHHHQHHQQAQQRPSDRLAADGQGRPQTLDPLGAEATDHHGGALGPHVAAGADQLPGEIAHGFVGRNGLAQVVVHCVAAVDVLVDVKRGAVVLYEVAEPR